MNADLARLLRTARLAGLGPGPRSGVMDEAAIRSAVEKLPARPGRSDALLALILLWHDHHEPAHEIAQAIETADGSYVHAILHRREPDYGNAMYWFRRVGAHPAFGELGRRVGELAKARAADPWIATLSPGGRWEPGRFVDACEAAMRGGSAQDLPLLEEIQQIEFEALAGYLSE